MSSLHTAAGYVVIGVNALAGLLGALRWWQGRPTRAFFRYIDTKEAMFRSSSTIRIFSAMGLHGSRRPGRAQEESVKERPAEGQFGQLLVLLQAAGGAVLLVEGKPLPRLHLIYGLIPLAVAFLAEQLRLASADIVLQQRGLEGSADVAQLPEEEQRALVSLIVRRETGVMAASALVVALLAGRAQGWLL